MVRARIATLALGVVLVLCLAGEAASQAKVHRVGMLWYGQPLDGRQAVIETFKQGLSEQGFVEGQNLVLEHRHAGPGLDALPGLAADLVRAKEVLE